MGRKRRHKEENPEGRSGVMGAVTSRTGVVVAEEELGLVDDKAEPMDDDRG